MFHTVIVQPIFNLLVLIYGILPGHNFGLAIIIFTVLIRTLMWPLVKKQLHSTKAMRKLQPKIKQIRKESGGDKQKETRLIMELYKESGVNPFGTLLLALVQMPILIGLYFAVKKIIDDPNQVVHYSYSFIKDLSWLQNIATDIGKFDETLFGIVDLTKRAIGENGIYWPAMTLVILSAAIQFYQSKQIMPKEKDAKTLKQIMSEAGQGKSASQEDITGAVSGGIVYVIPVMVFLFGLSFPAALPLYWLVGSLVAVYQQHKVLNEDVEEAEAELDKQEAMEEKTKKNKKPAPKKKRSQKRRKK